jgi:hypothetical protein
MAMGKAHLYEALYLVNQGTDEAVRGLARLKRSTEFEAVTYEKALATMEHWRAQVNTQFFKDTQPSEEADVKRFEEDRLLYEDEPVDQEKVYALVRMIEDERRRTGQPPMVQFLTPEAPEEDAP